jgi:hypothetical protein
MTFEKTEAIYNMSLHTTATIYGGPWTYDVLRVHGGWIYTTGNNNGSTLVSVFVPYKEAYEVEND